MLFCAAELSTFAAVGFDGVVSVVFYGWQAVKQATAPTNAIIVRINYFPYYYIFEGKDKALFLRMVPYYRVTQQFNNA